MGWGTGWGPKACEKSQKGVDAASLGDGFYPLSRAKFLFPFNLQLPCLQSHARFPVQPSPTPGPWRMGAQTPRRPRKWGAFSSGFQVGRVPCTTLPQVAAGTPIAPGSLHPLPSLPALALPPGGSLESLPQTNQGARPPGPLTYGAAVHTGVGAGGGWSSPGRSWRRVGVGGSEWSLAETRGAEQHALTRAEPSAALSVRSPALRSARECNLSPAV